MKTLLKNLLAATPLLGLLLGASIPQASTSVAQEGPRPNLLIFLTDDQALETMGVMPKTRSWFEAGGVEFTSAYATTPLCCPSRASIFSGRYTHNHDVRNNYSSSNFDHRTSMQRHLHDAGYWTGIVGKFFNNWPIASNPPHFDRWAIFSHGDYYNSRMNVNGDQRTIRRYSTDYIADKTVKMLNTFETEAADTKPWFLYVAPYAPHLPYTAEPEYATAAIPTWDGDPAVREADRSDKPPFVRTSTVSLREGKTLRRRQLRTLMSVDDMVNKVMAELGRLEEADNTIAVFMSDNGYFWGHHGLYDKRLPYSQAVRVPFYVRWPGHLTPGTQDGRLVANIDVAPSFLEAAGAPGGALMDGRSLWTGIPRERLLLEHYRDPKIFTNLPRWASTVTNTYQYVEYYTRTGDVRFREYYDLVGDPYQLLNTLGDANASNDPAYPELSAQLQADSSCAAGTCP